MEWLRNLSSSSSHYTHSTTAGKEDREELARSYRWAGVELRKRMGDAAGCRIRYSSRCRRRCSTLCRSNTQVPNKTWSTFSGRQEGIFKVAGEFSKEQRVLLLLLRPRAPRVEKAQLVNRNMHSISSPSGAGNAITRGGKTDRQMDMDISGAWSEQVMTCTCRSLQAQVRRGLQQKFKYKKLSLFAYWKLLQRMQFDSKFNAQ